MITDHNEAMAPVIIISAMSKDHIIGTQDGMPWNIPEEYQQYLSFVKGQTVIMGRKTYEIFGKDLEVARVLVISRSYPENNHYTVFSSLEDALEYARKFDETIFVAGGASIYQQALAFADFMYLSEIKGDFEGIVYFPEFDISQWDIVEEIDHEQFIFRKYKRA